MSKWGEADLCDRPQKFMKEHYRTFSQWIWRPIPAIGQNYLHHMFCLCSAPIYWAAATSADESQHESLQSRRASAVPWLTIKADICSHLADSARGAYSQMNMCSKHVYNETLGGRWKKSASKKKNFITDCRCKGIDFRIEKQPMRSHRL